MTDVPRFSEVLEGYLELAGQLLETWTPFLNDVSAEVDAGTYDAKDAADDFPTVARLTVESWRLIGSEAIDALAILTSDFSELGSVTGYTTDPKNSGMARTLSWKGDLMSVTGEKLPAERVKIVPAKLAKDATAFTLYFDGDGRKARTYDGHVVATDVSGTVQDDVFVSVTIG